MTDALSTLRASGEGANGDGGSGCRCAYREFLSECVVCVVALVECAENGCSALFHHLCSNKHEENLYRDAVQVVTFTMALLV